MKIYGANLSPYVRKVLVVAIHKGLEFEHEVVLPGSDDPGFRKISPMGKIPALVDGELAISDSTVICEYLEDQYPEVKMRPDDPAQRARARWYEEFGDSRMAEVFGNHFFERFVKPLMGDNSGPDEARLQDLAENVAPPALSYVESQVPESGFLFGDDLYIADISLVSSTVNGAYAGYGIDADQYPRTVAYRARVLSQPAVEKALAAEKAMLESFTG